MDLQQSSDITDGHGQLRQWIVLMYWWSRKYPVTNACGEAEVDEKTVIQI